MYLCITVQLTMNTKLCPKFEGQVGEIYNQTLVYAREIINKVTQKCQYYKESVENYYKMKLKKPTSWENFNG